MENYKERIRLVRKKPQFDKRWTNNDFKTTHNLQFEVAEWDVAEDLSMDFIRFRIGTCKGLYGFTENSYDILAIINDIPGNGHLTDVFEYFEHSCIRDNKSLRVLETWNNKFKEHLINKRGFEAYSEFNLIKKYKNDKT